MATLSERIDVLLDDADQLHAEIRKLRREINQREGIEAVDYLSDVPGDLLDAEDCLRRAVANLTCAVEDATKGASHE